MRELFERVATWPEEAVEELAASVRIIEQRHAEHQELTDDDWKIIDGRIKRRHLASDDEVQALFDQYRRV